MEGKSGLCKRRPFIIYDILKAGFKEQVKTRTDGNLKPKTVL